MRAEIYWIEEAPLSKLAIMPRPRGGDWLADEIESLRDQGVDTLVSLLVRDEVQELGLCEEAQLCTQHNIEFYSCPIPDRQRPQSSSEIEHLIESLDAAMKAGKAVAIHCRMGLGRSAIITAALLVLRGLLPDDALAKIATARGQDVPDTEEQVEWLRNFALQKEG